MLKSAAIGYGRRQPDTVLSVKDQTKQSQLLITYSENAFTNSIDGEDVYRTPLPCETRAYEMTGLWLANDQIRFGLEEMLEKGSSAFPIAYEAEPAGALQKRLIEQRARSIGPMTSDYLGTIRWRC